uniref:Conserved plasma membrane protein n=2 Tax=Macrostomum lignano TaxID=282301 RepID=A0A1I8FXU7_9PLAT
LQYHYSPSKPPNHQAAANPDGSGGGNGGHFGAPLLAQPPRRSLWSSLRAEVTSAYGGPDDDEKLRAHRHRVYTFLTIPLAMERFIQFGLLACLDTLLHLCTLLPLRCAYALWRLFYGRAHLLHSQKSDLLHGLLLVVTTCLIVQLTDSSVIYHFIRSQSVIKLYIFFNMLEIADRLLSAVSQDVLDGLAFTIAKPLESTLLLLLNWALSVVMVTLHSCLMLLQALTLNVGFNSHNRTLLTIIMSNNFVELKGSVFRKFAEENMFQLACADIRERFHCAVLLLIVLLRNMRAVNWELSHFIDICPDALIVLITELIVDSVKHAFIAKFNEMPASVYRSFSLRVALDLRRMRSHRQYLSLNRRMGLTPMPLFVLVAMSLYLALPEGAKLVNGLCLTVLVLPSLIVLKLIVGRFLHSLADKIILAAQSDEASANAAASAASAAAATDGKESASVESATADFNIDDYYGCLQLLRRNYRSCGDLTSSQKPDDFNDSPEWPGGAAAAPSIVEPAAPTSVANDSDIGNGDSVAFGHERRHSDVGETPELRHRRRNESSCRRDDEPLTVDRYSMYSNAIV